MLPVAYDMDTDAGLTVLRDFRDFSELSFTDEFALRVLTGINKTMRGRERKVTGPEMLGVLKSAANAQMAKGSKGTLAELMEAFWIRLAEVDKNLNREHMLAVPSVEPGRVKTVKLMALIRQGWQVRLQNGSIELLEATEPPADLNVSVTDNDHFAVAYALAAKTSPVGALIASIPKKPKATPIYA